MYLKKQGSITLFFLNKHCKSLKTVRMGNSGGKQPRKNILLPLLDWSVCTVKERNILWNKYLKDY